MIVTKFLLTWARLPPLIDALALGVNYGAGFVIMQLAHFTLATKQPAMTAAALAGAIATHTKTDFEPLVDQVTRAARTQLFALIGNVGVVLPVAFAIDAGLRAVAGHHLLDQPYAQHLIEAHHPFHSATVIHAAVTGVWLWAASLIAGAVENWFVLRELPGAIASNRWLRRRFGGQRAAHLARFMRNNISGFGGNVGFGLLLGLMPFLFHLVGLPLEVRHVTFVAGQLLYAGMAVGPTVATQPDFLWALLSIPLVGLVNFAVSFALAMIVALNARDQGVRAQTALVFAVLRRLVTRPGEFVLAPKPAPGVAQGSSTGASR
jgi:site-specific recombinase